MADSTVSIIIPVINEEEVLPVLLSFLKTLELVHLTEIIVADGGSVDNTVSIAENSGATVVKSTKGRAIQMNAGAAVAKGDILYFLHADTLPPIAAINKIIEGVKSGYEGGCMRLKFNTKSYFLKANAWITRFDINAIRFGDQSLYITKSLFNAIEGFDEEHIVLEDQEIINRIRKKTRFRVLDDYVTTSDRKYRENGAVKLQSIFLLIYVLYRLGWRQQRLLGLYRKWIRNGKT